MSCDFYELPWCLDPKTIPVKISENPVRLILEGYCSFMPNILPFKISHVRGFLVFSVSNAKYLTFGTGDANVLICFHLGGKFYWAKRKRK